MPSCAKVHEEYDRYANGELRVGPLPAWMHVKGKVAWYVFQGPYAGLPDAWSKFGEKLRVMGPSKFAGPPGDVYVCDPEDHKGEAQGKLVTILWAPLKE